MHQQSVKRSNEGAQKASDRPVFTAISSAPKTERGSVYNVTYSGGGSKGGLVS